MSAIQFLVTAAGKAALAAAAGSAAITIAEVGFTEAEFVLAPTLTALPGEFVRLPAVSGVAASPNMVHLTARDDSDASYALRGFGLYLDDGTLFGAYGQVDPIFNKAGLATYLLAIDLAFENGEAVLIEFGDANFAYPLATETTPGVAELATQAEVDAGTDPLRFVSPLTLAQRLTTLVTAVGIAISDAVANLVPKTRSVGTAGLATGGGDLSADRTITVAKASAAEIKAGADDAKAITPKGLRDAQSYSAGVAGHRISPDGHVEMWGQYRATHTGEGTVAIVFPIPFPTACDNIQLTGVTTDPSNVRDMWPQIVESTRTATGVSVQLQSDDGDEIRLDGFDWRAIGR